MGPNKFELAFNSARFLAKILVGMGLWLSPKANAADNTFVYAVQITVSVNESPTQIRLQWRSDPYGVNGFEVYRKSESATDWGAPLQTLPGDALGFTDYDVSSGEVYEYQVLKYGKLGYLGTGYAFAGIQAPPVEHRGRLLLVVATNKLAALETELTTLETNLAGDGWSVTRLEVSESSSPENVRNLIQAQYALDPQDTRCVFLLGHVPVLQSGDLNYDGHQSRPMPADAYYGDMDGYWPTDPAQSPSFIPSDLELAVGRVDFFDMPGIGSPLPWPSEVELIRNYLAKDHAWRHGKTAVPRLALMGNRRGDEGGLATAASGYRSFEPLVGAGNIQEADTSDAAPDGQRWVNLLSTGAYLLAYGCGGGLPTGVTGLGTHGTYGEAWSTDVVAGDAKAVFVMLFGSWFGNWDRTDNFMRSFLATPTLGLASCMSGEPHWFMHRLGLGETLGDCMLLNINNAGLYTSQQMDHPRAVYIALMGDPTLRLDPIPSPPGARAVRTGTTVQLAWDAAPAQVAGYYIYRSNSAMGGFTRLTAEPVTSLEWEDVTPSDAYSFYMVRAVRLESHFSGSYYNLSQGVQAQAEPPIRVSASVSAGSVQLTWNTVPGRNYRVQSRGDFSEQWQEASQILNAQGPSLQWGEDVQAFALRQYRIRAE
jgi:hypothetical protein